MGGIVAVDLKECQRRGFLHAIRERPGDDTPRLVYADWLEETAAAGAGGESERARAEFIRLTLKYPVHSPHPDLGPVRISQELLTRWGATWLGSAKYPLANLTWKGGFVHTIDTSTTALLYYAAEIFSEHPITEVRLTNVKPDAPSDVGYQLAQGTQQGLPLCLFEPLLYAKRHAARGSGRWPNAESERWLSAVCVAWGRQQATLREQRQDLHLRWERQCRDWPAFAQHVERCKEWGIPHDPQLWRNEEAVRRAGVRMLRNAGTAITPQWEAWSND